MTRRPSSIRAALFPLFVATAAALAACATSTTGAATSASANGWPVLTGMRTWCSSVTLAPDGSELHASYFAADGSPSVWVGRYRSAAPDAAVETTPGGGALFRAPSAERPDRVLVVRPPDTVVPSGCSAPAPTGGTVLALTRMTRTR